MTKNILLSQENPFGAPLEEYFFTFFVKQKRYHFEILTSVLFQRW